MTGAPFVRADVVLDGGAVGFGNGYFVAGEVAPEDAVLVAHGAVAGVEGGGFGGVADFEAGAVALDGEGEGLVLRGFGWGLGWRGRHCEVEDIMVEGPGLLMSAFGCCRVVEMATWGGVFFFLERNRGAALSAGWRLPELRLCPCRVLEIAALLIEVRG